MIDEESVGNWGRKNNTGGLFRLGSGKTLTVTTGHGIERHPDWQVSIVKTLRIIPAFLAGLLTIGCTAIDRDPILGSSPQTPIIKRNNTIPSPDKKSDFSLDN